MGAGIEVKMNAVNFKKVKKLANGMGRFLRVAPQIANEAIDEHMPAMEEEVKYYPPELPDQQYVRTFALRDGWEFDRKVSQNTYSLNVFNDTEYTGYVVGKPDLRLKLGGLPPAPIHRGRWPIAGGVIRKWYRIIQATYEEKALKRFENLTGFKVTKRSKTR